MSGMAAETGDESFPRERYFCKSRSLSVSRILAALHDAFVRTTQPRVCIVLEKRYDPNRMCVGP